MILVSSTQKEMKLGLRPLLVNTYPMPFWYTLLKFVSPSVVSFTLLPIYGLCIAMVLVPAPGALILYPSDVEVSKPIRFPAELYKLSFTLLCRVAPIEQLLLFVSANTKPE